MGRGEAGKQAHKKESCRIIEKSLITLLKHLCGWTSQRLLESQTRLTARVGPWSRAKGEVHGRLLPLDLVVDLGLLLVSRACSKEELPVGKKKKREWGQAGTGCQILCLSLIISNSDNLQRVMVTASFCMQVSLLSISNPEPYRIWVL